VDGVVRVPDAVIVEALGVLVREENVPAEPAAAAGLAALLSGVVEAPPGGRVVLVISGGNVAPDLLEQLAAG